MRYFPDKLPKGRLPDRNFFFTVLNSLNEQYISGLVKHATDARNQASEFKAEEETIVISEKMIGLLNQSPFLSCKFII